MAVDINTAHLLRIVGKLNARLTALAIGAEALDINLRADVIGGATMEAISDSYAAGVIDERAWVLTLLENLHVFVMPDVPVHVVLQNLRSVLIESVRTHRLPQPGDPVDRPEDKPTN